MSAKKKNSGTRHGKRADGKTATSISISESILMEARKAAEEDDRSFSNWLEQALKEALRKAGRISLWMLLIFLVSNQGPVKQLQPSVKTPGR